MDASKAMIDEFFAGCDKISILELVRIQARVLVPLLRAFRKEIGRERADRIAGEALSGLTQALTHSISAQIGGPGVNKFEEFMGAFMPKIGSDVNIEPITETPDQLKFNVTGCRYADFFRQLGEPELGSLLVCEGDFHLTEQIGGPDMKLERTQTIMKGAKYCDFRWSMKRGPE